MYQAGTPTIRAEEGLGRGYMLLNGYPWYIAGYSSPPSSHSPGTASLPHRQGAVHRLLGAVRGVNGVPTVLKGGAYGVFLA